MLCLCICAAAKTVQVLQLCTYYSKITVAWFASNFCAGTCIDCDGLFLHGVTKNLLHVPVMGLCPSGHHIQHLSKGVFVWCVYSEALSNAGCVKNLK